MVVAVPHAPIQHVGDGLETAMRMVGEAGDVVGRGFRTEFVQQQERIERIQHRLADHTGQLDTGAIGRGDAAYAAGDGAGRHGSPPGSLDTPKMRPRAAGNNARPGNTAFAMTDPNAPSGHCGGR